MLNQIEFLKPSTVIPLASYIYFCHEENFYHNDCINKINSCNFFIVRSGEVWTSTGDYCLNGITRQKVIEICKLEGIPIFEKNFSLVEVYGADESFLTGTFGAQVPVGLVDGRPIGNGVAGDITKRIRSAYFDLIEKNTQC